MTETEGFNYWAKAWTYELQVHSKLNISDVVMDKEQNFLYHIEGYILDIMHFASLVPETVTNSTYIQSIINFVSSLNSQFTN